MSLADRYPQSPVCGQVLRRLPDKPRELRPILLRMRPRLLANLCISPRRVDVSALPANRRPARTFDPDIRVQRPPRTPGYRNEVDCKNAATHSIHGGEARSALTSGVGRLPEDRKTPGHHHKCPKGSGGVCHRPRHWSHPGKPPSFAPKPR